MRICIAGYYGYGNFGDELILKGIIRLLRHENEEIEVIVFSSDPEETRAMHQVQSIFFRDLESLERILRTSDALLIGGGGLFHDYWGVQVDTFRTPSFHGLTYYATIADLAYKLDIPLFLFGVGIGPLKTETGKRFTRFICERARRIWVRDHASIRILKEEMHVSRPVAWVPDGSIAELVHFMADDREKKGSDVVGLNLRFWFHHERGLKWEKDVLRLLESMREKAGMRRCFLFALQKGERFIENDEAYLRIMSKRIRKRVRMNIERYRLDPRDKTWVDALRECSVFIGMRLHSLLLASVFVPNLIGLAYDPKVREVCRSLDIPIHILSFDDMRIHPEWFVKYDNEHLEYIHEKMYEHEKELKKQINELFGSIDSGGVHRQVTHTLTLPGGELSPQVNFTGRLCRFFLKLYFRLPIKWQLYLYRLSPSYLVNWARKLYHR